jgi:aspartate kinase
VIVIKFGGTSVGDAERVANAIDIVAERRDRHPIVVVSALAGVTNDLVAATEAARSSDIERVNQIVNAIRQRHEDVAMRLVQQKFDFFESFIKQLDKQIEQIHTILRGIALLGEITLRAKDKVEAIGEKLSSVLFAYSMMMRALPGEHVDSEEVVITDNRFGEANPLMDETREAARRVLLPLIERNLIPVMGGFIGRSRDGATTTLGRGGSDYSAAIVGAAVGAEEIQIWTDVDGMLTADPRIVPEPRLVPQLSFAEASELAYFGAKVLHPSTILPAVSKNIPVRILNSRRPESGGTRITADGAPVAGQLTAIACKRDVTVVDITSTRMLMAHGFLRRLFEVFERFKTAVDVVTTSEVSVSVTVDDTRRLEAILDNLHNFAEASCEREMAIICAVGENLRGDPTLFGRAVTALERIPLRLVSQAASRRNITFVLRNSDVPRAMTRLHEQFFQQA